VVSYVALAVVGSCFVALGTVVSTTKVAAVAAMAVIGFAVLFAGIVSPQAATGSTAALLSFVLPVAVPQPAGAVGPRLVGWALASAFCNPACVLVWPTPWHDDLRRRLSATVAAVGRLASAQFDGRPIGEAHAEVTSELASLRRQFRGTPYPPTGAAASAVGLAKLVGRVEWVIGNAAMVAEADTPPPASARAVMGAVAELLALSASLICDGHGHPVDDPARSLAVEEALRRLDELVAVELDTEISTLIGTGAEPAPGPAPGPLEWSDGGRPVPRGAGIASSLDPSFEARALGIATAMVADATLEAAGSRAGDDRRLGGDRDAVPRRFLGQLASYLSLRSVWFRNALRGAAGLAAAVAVVEVTAIEHGFWVVLGTLSVLRSNALGTGATAARAVAGTAVGFVVGSVIMIGVGSHAVLLWVLLPIAVLVSGVAPSMISFAAGQAGFTIVVIILFNIIEPLGWKVGLTRIEDVTIGCGVSVVVGLLFWPRGATAALGRSLSDAFVENSGYLADAVDRLTTTTRDVDTLAGQRASHRAYLRLDDAFRQFLAERGAKVVPIETVANLFTGANRLRLAAFMLATLPTGTTDEGHRDLESVAIAGAVLRDSYASSHRWYEKFARMLAEQRPTLEPPAANDEVLRNVLREAFDDARRRGQPEALRTMLQMLWADEVLEAQREVQDALARSAELFVRPRRRSRTVI
jgi:uncharacterized membrane protein YccC